MNACEILAEYVVAGAMFESERLHEGRRGCRSFQKLYFPARNSQDSKQGPSNAHGIRDE